MECCYQVHDSKSCQVNQSIKSARKDRQVFDKLFDPNPFEPNTNPVDAHL